MTNKRFNATLQRDMLSVSDSISFDDLQRQARLFYESPSERLLLQQKLLALYYMACEAKHKEARELFVNCIREISVIGIMQDQVKPTRR